MKKIIYCLITVALLALNGCDESAFLTEEPRDNIYSENLLVDYQGFQSMITSLQGLMRKEYCRLPASPIVLNGVFGGGADNTWGNNIGTTGDRFNFMIQPLNIRRVDNELYEYIFEWLYQIVNTSNMVISRTENGAVNWDGTNESEAETNKNTIVAQARFFRAWAYRHLTYAYGAVPLSTEEITGDNYRTDWERTPVSEIRETMIADFQFAIDHLPLRATNNNYLSAAMARHYLGELYLAESNPVKAIEVLKPLVESSEYELMKAPFGKSPANPACPFIDVFTSPSYKDGNKEVLYYFTNAEPLEAATGVAPQDGWMKSTYKSYYSNDGVIKRSNLDAPEYTSGKLTYNQVFWLNNGGKGTARLSPSPGALRLYNYKGMGEQDLRMKEPAMLWTIWEKNAEGQIQPFLVSGKTPIDSTITARMLDPTQTTIQNYKWPSVRKWDYTQKVESSGDIDPNYNDLPYLRIADTYLLYAEALFKKGDNGEAIKWINKVRNRAGVVDITESDLSADGLDLILDERSRELLCEEERRHTLIRVSQENGGDEREVDNYFKRRTRQLNQVLGVHGRGMDTYDLPVLLPIPNLIIESNSGKPMEQNPGY
ncbi:MAG: RagB/SusD family nutrient uptake outer membrane protein [Tannerellaceae bacterium]|jgi:hypothetical protein|nr:RagB/SusD family nutrient uptake outer membrane protein [Tannerellaceae bacterium]